MSWLSNDDTLGMRYLALFFCLFIFSTCSVKKKTEQSAVTKPMNATLDTLVQQPVSTASSEQKTAKDNATGSTTWQYSKRVDNEGRTVYKASITSPKLLDFEFPYEGGSVATLTIRKRESDTHVYIQVSKGQFNRSFQGGKARIRFDNKPVVTYGFSAAENGSANVIFFDSEQSLIRQLKTARTMVVDAEFAGQGTRQILFQTANFNWTY